jgi:hypothetical protein
MYYMYLSGAAWHPVRFLDRMRPASHRGFWATFRMVAAESLAEKPASRPGQARTAVSATVKRGTLLVPAAAYPLYLAAAGGVVVAVAGQRSAATW